MDWKSHKKSYYQYRRSLYASINARKGNMITLSKSKLLNEKEKEHVDNIINELELLRLEISKKNNMRKKIIYPDK